MVSSILFNLSFMFYHQECLPHPMPWWYRGGPDRLGDRVGVDTVGSAGPTSQLWVLGALCFGATWVLFPVLDCTFPLEEAAKAHAYVAENQSFGKVVLTV